MLVINHSSGQDNQNLNDPLWAFHVSYGVELPFGDVADRFGANLQFGSGIERVTRSNYIFGLDYKFQFSNNVKEDPLELLRFNDGQILNIQNGESFVLLRQRGAYIGVLGGKLFQLFPTLRGGLRLTAGAGYWYHYIRLQDDSNAVPQVFGDYAKGYDKRSGGFTLKQQIFYQQLSRKTKLNFYAGFELMQGFTKGLRPFDYDTLSINDESRLDLSIGFKVGWILPFYSGNYVSEEVFY